MIAFLSHNKADKNVARALALALSGFGIESWFDEWKIRPGESILGSIEDGLRSSELFVLVWSSHAAASTWVGTEWMAFVRRRVDDKSLRVIPIMLDSTPLPVLVADYKGFSLHTTSGTIEEIAYEIAGRPTKDLEVARLHRILLQKLHGDKPLEFQPLAIFCENCYSTNLEHGTSMDEERDDTYYGVQCLDCGWSTATEV